FKLNCFIRYTVSKMTAGRGLLPDGTDAVRPFLDDLAAPYFRTGSMPITADRTVALPSESISIWVSYTGARSIGDWGPAIASSCLLSSEPLISDCHCVVERACMMTPPFLSEKKLKLVSPFPPKCIN